MLVSTDGTLIAEIARPTFRTNSRRTIISGWTNQHFDSLCLGNDIFCNGTVQAVMTTSDSRIMVTKRMFTSKRSVCVRSRGESWHLVTLAAGFFVRSRRMQLCSAHRAKENGPAIHPWDALVMGNVPQGRQTLWLECEEAKRDFFRPYGTFFGLAGDPAMNRWAIFGRSLRELQATRISHARAAKGGRQSVFESGGK
jgi:hypothetical protein